MIGLILALAISAFLVLSALRSDGPSIPLWILMAVVPLFSAILYWRRTCTGGDRGVIGLFIYVITLAAIASLVISVIRAEWLATIPFAFLAVVPLTAMLAINGWYRRRWLAAGGFVFLQTCPRCGHEIPADIKSCPHCGNTDFTAPG